MASVERKSTNTYVHVKTITFLQNIPKNHRKNSTHLAADIAGFYISWIWGGTGGLQEAVLICKLSDLVRMSNALPGEESACLERLHCVTRSAEKTHNKINPGTLEMLCILSL